MTKAFWITNSRFRIIIIVMLIIWISMFALFYMKADEVTKDPCSVCANRIGEEVTCGVGNSGRIIKQTYYPNFTILSEVGE